MTEERSGKTEKLMSGSTQTQVCIGCGKDYEAKIIFITINPIDISQGLCYECRAKKEAELKKQEEIERRLELDRKRNQWRAECGIPLKFMNEEFGTFDTKRPGNVKKIHDVCLKYAKGFPIDYYDYLRSKKKAYPSLLLVSPDVWGIGKTHLACAIGHNILNRYNGEGISCPIHFVSEPELMDKLRATINYSQEERQYREGMEEIMAPLLCRPLLILDDLGKVPVRDPRFVQRTLFSIIESREKSLRPMVVTTNLNTTQLRNYLGSSSDEASYDRLIGMTKDNVWRMTGESYRRITTE